MRWSRGASTIIAVVMVTVIAALLVVVPAPAKTLTRAVLVGSDGAWVRVSGTARDFENLARNPASKPRRIDGGFVRLYFVGPGDFPANRARYYPRQRCIALDWPAYERSCRALNSRLVGRFSESHALARFTERPTVLSRLRHVSSTGRPPPLAALTGSVELALLRTGTPRSATSGCYDLVARWDGPAADERPRRLSLCRSGVFADGLFHPLSRVVWEWFRRNFGPPAPAPEPPIAEQPVECGGDDVKLLVERFVGAFNGGDYSALDGHFAQEPDFQWYSTGGPGERLLPVAADRESLVPYFRTRHELGERLAVKSFRFNGNGRTARPYGNFEYVLTRSADDLVPTEYGGKGAALCYRGRPDSLIVWSMSPHP
jgi:hypothetical protein